MNVFRTELSKSFRGDVVDDSESLEVASRDASLFYVRPQVVVFPRDAKDLEVVVAAALAARAAGEDISLTPRAAGTDMSGGPLSQSVVVDCMRYFTSVPEVGDGVASTEPGVFYRDFEKATLEKGWLFPSYPASREIAAMGGIIANNAGGEKSLMYGKTANFVRSIRAVLSDGNTYLLRKLSREELEAKKALTGFEGKLYREMHALLADNWKTISAARPHVSKNSTGYALWDAYDPSEGSIDLSKIFCGSQGTLGFWTRAELALIRPKTAHRTVVVLLDDLARLGDLVNTLLLAKPESIESFDDKTVRVALLYFGDIVKRLKGNLFTLAFQFLPEFLAVLFGGMPKLIVVAEFTGETDAAALAAANAAQESLRSLGYRTHVTRSERESEKFWVMRRESFSLLRKHTKHMRTAPFIDDIVVPPRVLPEFLPKLYAILDLYKAKMVYTIAGHVGDGNFHIIPLMDLLAPGAGEVIREMSGKVYDLVFSYGGSMSGEHNDGLVRTPFLRQMYGEKMYGLFASTKQIFDPNNLFNPRKKIVKSAEEAEKYALAHLDTKV
ncbi:MAG: FAD-binding oxidoreductase [Patescibacteria group bacterium]